MKKAIRMCSVLRIDGLQVLDRLHLEHSFYEDDRPPALWIIRYQSNLSDVLVEKMWELKIIDESNEVTLLH